MRNAKSHPEPSNTILFLHGPWHRTTRLIHLGLAATAARHGWSVQHATPPDNADSTYLRKLVSFWNPLGVVAIYSPDKTIPMPSPDISIPFICIDFDPSLMSRKRKHVLPCAGFVQCDSKKIAEIAAKTLLDMDFAAYAYVSAYSRFHWSEQRKRHFKAVLKLNGRTCHCFDGTGLAASGTAKSAQLGSWLSALPKPCGLLAANDHTAMQVLSVAAREGIKVPDELSVLGIDDDEDICGATTPQLSSIRCDFCGGGMLAGEMINRFLTHRQDCRPDECYGVTRVTIRQSTRKALRNTPSIRQALEAIQLRAIEGISAADVIPLIGGSRRSAERKFRAAVGHGILEEILNVRFEKVKKLLTTPILLKALSDQTGFSSSNNLQRLFKARFGMTLTDYRRRLQEEA